MASASRKPRFFRSSRVPTMNQVANHLTDCINPVTQISLCFFSCFSPILREVPMVLGSGVLINFCRFPSGTGISVANAGGESISQADCVSQWPSWCLRLVVYCSTQVII